MIFNDLIKNRKLIYDFKALKFGLSACGTGSKWRIKSDSPCATTFSQKDSHARLFAKKLLRKGYLR